jgi:hypothetical protein
MIRAKQAQINITTVEGELNVEESARGSLRSAKTEALGVVEQKMIDKAFTQERTHGKLLNEATAIKQENIVPFQKRHQVKAVQTETVIKAGEDFTKSKLNPYRKQLTVESKEGPLAGGKGAKQLPRILTGLGGVTLPMEAKEFNRAMDPRERVDLTMPDSDGRFTLSGPNKDGWFKPGYYEKTYIDKTNEDGSAYVERINEEQGQLLKEDYENLYGEENWWSGDLEGGLIPEIKSDPCQDDDYCS